MKTKTLRKIGQNEKRVLFRIKNIFMLITYFVQI